jgi:hypothetical protein
MQKQQFCFSFIQCSSKPVGFGQGLFLAKNNVTTRDYPNLAPADFYLSPPLKSASEGTALL